MMNENGPRLSNSLFLDKLHRRQMEGFTHVKATDEDGKDHYELVYTGNYYRMELPRKKRIALRLIYLALVAVMAAAFLYASSRRLGANIQWYAGMCQMLVLCGTGKLLMDLINHSTAPRPMTIGEWKNASRSLRRSSLATAGFIALTAVCTAVYLVLGGEKTAQHLLCIGLYVLAGAAVGSINLIENKVPYTIYLSRDTPPPDPWEGE